MNRALFLDRDGVINEEKDYLYKIKDFEFIDGVFEACQYFQKKGYMIFIITNQSGIARGIYTEYDYKTLTDWMLKEFLKKSIAITKVYHCPHHPDITGFCLCRKPQPKMIIDAQKEFNLDLKKSILVGDKMSDINAGLSAGISHNYLIETGHPIAKNNNRNVVILKNLTYLKKVVL
ncbi:MAG: D-glycero-beta-D-manno-heptose-1,7-bisphosphate 7-phosphatase [Proteobacteria bacterium]|nr:MAG: D-glycero-beta-D-manno-heptose-1,7-bisphosphate 7-phosphatase [Pseudomonadota bacterium]